MTKRTDDFLGNARRHSTSHAAVQRRKGLVRVSVWVPDKDAERLRNIAAQLRKDADKQLPDDGHHRQFAAKVPVVEAPRYPEANRVWLRIGQEELGLHMLLRTNGGVWRGSHELWDVPEHLPGQLGLQARVVHV